MDTWFGELSYVERIATLISVIGFPILLVQMGLLRKNIQGSTHDRIYGHYKDVCQMFVEYPELRPFFYEREKLIGGDKELERRVYAASEAILGLIEHAVVQRKNMPSGSWVNCWRPYAIERIRTSPTISEFFLQNREWYTDEMRLEYDAISEDISGSEPEIGLPKFEVIA